MLSTYFLFLAAVTQVQELNYLRELDLLRSDSETVTDGKRF